MPSGYLGKNVKVLPSISSNTGTTKKGTEAKISVSDFKKVIETSLSVKDIDILMRFNTTMQEMIKHIDLLLRKHQSISKESKKVTEGIPNKIHQEALINRTLLYKLNEKLDKVDSKVTVYLEQMGDLADYKKETNRSINILRAEIRALRRIVGYREIRESKYD